MRLYIYDCRDCGHDWETNRKDATVNECPECNSERIHLFDTYRVDEWGNV